MSATADPATQARALQLLEEGLSSVEVGRQLGVSPNTIRTWKARAGQSGPPHGARPTEDWATAREAAARDSFAAAQRALRRVVDLIDTGKAREAKDAALAFAILVDKAGVLEVAAATARTRVLNAESVTAELPAPELPADDAERMEQIAAILAEVGVLRCPHCGDRRDDDGDDNEPRLPPLLPPPVRDPESAPEPDAFQPMAAPRRVVRALDGNGEPAGPPRRQPEPEPVGQAPGWRPAHDDEAELLEPDEVLAAVHWEDRLWRP